MSRDERRNTDIGVSGELVALIEEVRTILRDEGIIFKSRDELVKAVVLSFLEKYDSNLPSEVKKEAKPTKHNRQSLQFHPNVNEDLDAIKNTVFAHDFQVDSRPALLTALMRSLIKRLKPPYNNAPDVFDLTLADLKRHL